ncbi:MAG: transporter substrate-binding domain-containing protein [Methylocystaceae bacterium]|nr:transporter substrate-binding domain-containing protein [Methylocystaceae bacterium]
MTLEAKAVETVKVGVAHFPPFYDVTPDGNVKGLGMDVIQALNELQKDYEFVAVPTTPRRRHQMFVEKKYDMSFFDHLAWGWDKTQVDTTDVYLSGGEVFITAKKAGRSQSYFNDIKDKSIAAILGYNYKFADYQTDPETLKYMFNITLTKSPEQIIKLVSSGYVDIGVITKTYLLRYFKKDANARKTLLISDHYDQSYHFRTIVRKGVKPSADYLNQLMQVIRSDPSFAWIKDKYGITW